MSRFTPRDAGNLIRAHWYKMVFQFALRHMKLTLNEASVENNVKLFKSECRAHGEKDALAALKQCEEEGLLEVYFKPDPIKEGEEYMFRSGGELMLGTIVTCDCCGGWSHVNAVKVVRNNSGVLPAKILENIPEMAGWSEERGQAECDTCSMNDGKPKPKKKARKKKAA